MLLPIPKLIEQPVDSEYAAFVAANSQFNEACILLETAGDAGSDRRAYLAAQAQHRDAFEKLNHVLGRVVAMPMENPQAVVVAARVLQVMLLARPKDEAPEFTLMLRVLDGLEQHFFC